VFLATVLPTYTIKGVKAYMTDVTGDEGILIVVLMQVSSESKTVTEAAISLLGETNTKTRNMAWHSV
jgi:hypothetical protein